MCSLLKPNISKVKPENRHLNFMDPPPPRNNHACRGLIFGLSLLAGGLATPAFAQTTHTVSISIFGNQITEGSSGSFSNVGTNTITTTVSPTRTQAFIIGLNSNGNAIREISGTVSGADYAITTLGGSNFASSIGHRPNQANAQVGIQIMGDRIDEPDETAIISLEKVNRTPSDVAISKTAGSVTFIIKDDDPTTVTLGRTGSSGAVSESETVEFTVTLGRSLIAGEIIDVPLAIGGTGVTTADWSLALKDDATLNTGVTLVNETTATPVVRFSDAAADTATLILTTIADNTPEASGSETLTLALAQDAAFDLESRMTNVGGGADPATDAANNTFNITINDAAAPVIDSDAAVSVAEGTAKALDIMVTDTDNDPLTYTITAGADRALFTINSSGALNFTTAPDFENPSDQGRNNEYVVEVTVGDGTYNTKKTFTITVTDENDNDPMITSDNTKSVAEGTTDLLTVAATDADAGTVITYSISGGADGALFNINENTGALAFTTAPDFENPRDQGGNNEYVVEVTASDGTNTDTQTITITVTDVSVGDNPPMLTPTATASVAENTTDVLTVAATDPDAGTTLTYSITAGADSAQFSIDQSTGDLAFKTTPDFEGASADGDDNYEVIVTVSDGTNSAMQTITVMVTDVNEAPMITAQTFSVTENAAAGTTVGTVAATDEDAGNNLTFSITAGNTGNAFAINASSGAITVAGTIDHETTPTYTLTVQVSDGDLSATAAVTVNVTDVNEPPVITSNATVSVAENTTTVLTVTATDADAGTTLNYPISGGADRALFRINRTSGALAFATAPDFEMPADQGSDNEYVVEVTASDGTKSAMQTITITVTNDPSDDILGFSINEDATVIFPNPSGHYLEVRSVAEGTFQLLSLSGEPLLEGTTNTKVDIASLQSGLYLVQLSDGRLLKFVRE